MTVVAYSSKHRVLATDSRMSDEDGNLITNCQKLYRLKSGALLGLCGQPDDRDIIRLLESASPRKLPTRAQLIELKLDFGALLVFPKGQVFGLEATFSELAGDHGEWGADVMPIRDRFAAAGCGRDFAIGAMEHGASPVEAVRIACRRNSFCSLPVQWEKLG